MNKLVYLFFGLLLSTTTFGQLNIGDTYQGGIVFYIDNTTMTALICAPTDQNAAWGCSGTSIPGANGFAIGTGLSNTTAITSACSETPIAAQLSATFTGGGNNDWYLPSLDELLEIYQTIGLGATGANNNIGNFQSTFYWSSTEGNANFGRVVNLGFGTTTTLSKNTSRNFRPIREVSTILPVELISFSGSTKSKMIALQWKTASELNNKKFEIQKSMDGRDWETIDFLTGKGSTSEVNEYHYQDLTPFPGLNYYRLKQIDFDGRFEYSKTISIKFDLKSEITLFPNPTNGNLNIVGDINENATIYIYNTAKQLVKTDFNNSSSLDLSELPKGLYFITIKTEKEEFTRKLILK